MTDGVNDTSYNCTDIFRNSTCTLFNSVDNRYAGHVPKLKEGAWTYFVLGMILSWIWTVLIVILNIVVISVICRYKKKSRLYFFLLNLAIADLATGLIDALPHALERTIGLQYVVTVWQAGDVLCKIQRTLANVSMMSSNYILAVMSMDRAFVICRPMLSLQRGNILQKATIALCWTFCLLCCSPNLRFYRTTYYSNRYLFSNKQQCILYFGENLKDILLRYKVRLYLMFVLMFLVPLLLIMASYTALVVSIYNRAKRQTASERYRAGPGEDRLTMSRVFNKAVPKSKVKSIKLTLGIVSSFLVCWMAYFTGYFLAIYSTFRHPSLLILTTFYYWNSIANPVLFFVYHKRKLNARSRASWVISETSQYRHTYSAERAELTSILHSVNKSK